LTSALIGVFYATCRITKPKPVAEQKFDVLVTTDKNLPFQQNVARFRIGVVVLRARSARLRHLRELVPRLLMILGDVKAGEVHTISWRDLA
jgi:hypothetical protein